MERIERFPTRWVGNSGWSRAALRLPTHRVGNAVSIYQIELAKVANIGGREALAITFAQLLRQAFDQGFAIGCARFALLKGFNHLAADVRIGRHCCVVDRAYNLAVRGIQDGRDPPEQTI
jgi:hypothetical protein